MKVSRSWVRLPTRWIAGGGLRFFTWGKGGGSDHTAALMLLLAIAHRAADENGIARLPYDELQWATHLSRAKIANGLDCLELRELIVREPQGRSTFQLTGYDPRGGWAVLPAKALYNSDGMVAFADFHLRSRNELEALKAYLAFVARRDRNQNRAFMTHAQINDYAGIADARIKSAISLLINLGLVVVEHLERKDGQGSSHAYRLPQVQPRKHLGTIGRSDMDAVTASSETQEDIAF